MLTIILAAARSHSLSLSLSFSRYFALHLVPAHLSLPRTFTAEVFHPLAPSRLSYRDQFLFLPPSKLPLPYFVPITQFVLVVSLINPTRFPRQAQKGQGTFTLDIFLHVVPLLQRDTNIGFMVVYFFIFSFISSYAVDFRGHMCQLFCNDLVIEQKRFDRN